MMNSKLLNPRLIAFSVALLCVALLCGEQASVAGIQGTGRMRVLAVGRITAFGSIFVNGAEYGVSGAQIRIDDRPSTESQLQVGQIVTLTGELDAAAAVGAASDVSTTAAVRGPIESLDPVNHAFVVLGQTVFTDVDTVFGESLASQAVDGLTTGAVVEVSAFEQSSGALLASRVDVRPGVGSAQVRGRVQLLSKSARTFRINSLVVSYGNAGPGVSIKNGDTVIVEGPTPAVGAPLQATRVQVPEQTAPANVLGEFEGLITRYTTSAEFWIGDQRITTNGKTRFSLHGQQLGPNLAVAVDGVFDTSGALVAHKVDAPKKSQNVARGPVDSVSAASRTLNLLGVQFGVTNSTAFDDQTGQHVRPFGLSDLRPGDSVEVHGLADAAGTGYVATAVTRIRPKQDVELRGVVIKGADQSFTVLGVRVMTGQRTKISAPASISKRVGAETSVLADRLVEVRGNFSGGTLVAERIQVLAK